MGYFEARSTAIGLVKGGEIVAGVIYENWNGASIMAHLVAEGRLTRHFIAAIFDYPFRVCGVGKVICPVVSSNVKSRKLLSHMGFECEGELKDAHPQGDLLLYTLRKDACRFLGENYGKIRARTSTGS